MKTVATSRVEAEFPGLGMTGVKSEACATEQTRNNGRLATLHDTDLLARLPKRQWFAAGAVSQSAAKLARLCRLGMLKRRLAAGDTSRTWDYWREV
jgi:hypothetical protein